VNSPSTLELLFFQSVRPAGLGDGSTGLGNSSVNCHDSLLVTAVSPSATLSRSNRRPVSSLVWLACHGFQESCCKRLVGTRIEALMVLTFNSYLLPSAGLPDGSAGPGLESSVERKEKPLEKQVLLLTQQRFSVHEWLDWRVDQREFHQNARTPMTAIFTSHRLSFD